MEGRRCEAADDLEDSMRHFEAAIEHFLAADLVRETVRVYERMAKFREAAGRF